MNKAVVEMKKKANKILGVLQRNLTSCSAVVKERAYLSLVRPICEYGSVAWSPYSYFEKGCRKNVHATIPKGNMGYDQYTVPDD